jgi:hypothetical protein
MKNAILFVVGSILLCGIAANSSERIVIDGLQSQYRTHLQGVVTHTEYRQEQREETCSREVLVGYREECGYVGGGGQVCHDVGGGQSCGLTPNGYQCFDLPGHRECEEDQGTYQCDQVPEYRTEYYTCTKTISVPYEVKDYDVENDVTVVVEQNQQLPQPLHEVIDLSQSGNSVTLTSVQSSAKVLVYATQTSSEVSHNGFIRRLKTIVNIKLVDRQSALGAFLSPITGLAVNSNGFQITTGLILDPQTVRFDVHLERKKLFKDEKVLSRTLQAHELSFENVGNTTIVRVDFQKLGVRDRIAGKKIQLSVSVQSTVNLDNVVNRQDIPQNTSERKSIEKKL